MPAAPVNNPPWATGTWSDTAWEEDTWGVAMEPPLGGTGDVIAYTAFQPVIVSCGCLVLLLVLL